ncbi:hypothetical protein ART_0591 [Arthrobacter sp. PAMC 25486]|uniref:hypothetical protein n=1 Tax=Arthrobacter sp. PAMC 25486 TaxID=1494608 RepID=UPI000535EAED|nr:hypothetical protein [Arthrobacter sp. PAMC 25486]AIY00190.1 hypothetical protein ART_0591 [Arthrobacter sp. PAMC 25486]
MILPRDFIDAALRMLIAVALAIDAIVHLQLASYYQVAVPGGIGQGNLFRIEAVAAILAGLYVLLRGSRPAYAAALVVAAGGVAAVLLYRYVNVPAFGPIPAMYEPVWFFQKSFSAVAEGAGAVLAAVGLFRPRIAH